MITALDEGLKVLSADTGGEAWGVEKLGAGELRRRRDLVASARKERDGLEALANTFVAKNIAGNAYGGGGGRAIATAQSKSELFGHPDGSPSGRGSRTAGRVLGAPMPETERTRELDNEGVLQLQKQLMQDQDQDIEQLTKGVRRLKELGVAINGELEVQNDMLKLVDEDTERYVFELLLSLVLTGYADNEVDCKERSTSQRRELARYRSPSPC
jgi:regulator of vacuolar morphogenesis